MKRQNPQINWIEFARKNPRLALVLVVILLIGGAVYLVVKYRSRTTAPPVVTGLPEMVVKPKPVNAPFKGCPPEGDGGDPALNRLKNRVDESNYIAAPFDAVEQLPWPKGIERRDRANWAASDAREVARYEGIPISVEGYLAGSREEGPESCNCHGADSEFHDFHLWMTKNANEDRSHAIVVEVTPIVRAKHPNWRTDLLGQLARKDQRVRISGWLMLDPEHPDQVGKTRGTIWEIHPIMKMETLQDGRWTDLDNLR